MLIENGYRSEWPYYQTYIYVIDGQNITQIGQYKQLNNTDGWNPSIPIPFTMLFYDSRLISINFVSNKPNNFRDWYPLRTNL